MFKQIFKKRKQAAVVFVDYENWYYSHIKLHGCRPKINEWHEGLLKQFDTLQIYFFADFTKLANELPRISEITDKIISTPYATNKKNMTDFIMLDYIYQAGNERKSPKTFIIFSGDGHFKSVVNYLTGKRRRAVIVYGVRGALSSQLKLKASKFVEVPIQHDQWDLYARMIVRNMDYVAKRQNIIPTFSGTAKAISRQQNIPQEEIEMVLSEMISKGYIYKKEVFRPPNNRVKTLVADWDLLKRDGYIIHT